MIATPPVCCLPGWILHPGFGSPFDPPSSGPPSLMRKGSPGPPGPIALPFEPLPVVPLAPAPLDPVPVELAPLDPVLVAVELEPVLDPLPVPLDELLLDPMPPSDAPPLLLPGDPASPHAATCGSGPVTWFRPKKSMTDFASIGVVCPPPAWVCASSTVKWQKFWLSPRFDGSAGADVVA